MVGDAVEPAMYIDLEIEGVKVKMVDTGAQLTIISRVLLHKIVEFHKRVYIDVEDGTPLGCVERFWIS